MREPYVGAPVQFRDIKSVSAAIITEVPKHITVWAKTIEPGNVVDVPAIHLRVLQANGYGDIDYWVPYVEGATEGNGCWWTWADAPLHPCPNPERHVEATAYGVRGHCASCPSE